MKIKVFTIRIESNFREEDERITNEFMENYKILKTASSFSEVNNCWSILVYYSDTNDKNEKNYLTKSDKEHNDSEHVSKKIGITKEDLEKQPLDELEIHIVNNLKEYRNSIASQKNLPSYMILSNNNIFSIARFKPLNISALAQIQGFGAQKIDSYGDDIISIINSSI